jgi:hypothetical protein
MVDKDEILDSDCSISVVVKGKILSKENNTVSDRTEGITRDVQKRIV